MAYKPVQYDFFNPMQELVPLVQIYNKAYQAQDKKYEEYMDWLSSSSELLDRDEGAKALKEKYQNDLNIMADALAKGDLRTAHTVDPRRYWYPLKTKQKQAEILSNLIKEQRNGDPQYVYTQRYNENTPLGSITEGSTYGKKALKDLEDIGKSIGQQINDTNPEVIGYIMNGATALVQQGVPVEQAIEEMMGDTPLSQMIEQEVNNFQLVDPYEQQKARSAIRNGILQGVGTRTTTMHNSSWRSPEQIERDEDRRKDREAEEALEYMYRTGGDYSELLRLGKAFEGSNSKGETVVRIGSTTYKTIVLDKDRDAETLMKIAIEKNPELAKPENKDKLDDEVKKLADQKIKVAIPETASAHMGNEKQLYQDYLDRTKVGKWDARQRANETWFSCKTIKIGDEEYYEIYDIKGNNRVNRKQAERDLLSLGLSPEKIRDCIYNTYYKDNMLRNNSDSDAIQKVKDDIMSEVNELSESIKNNPDGGDDNDNQEAQTKAQKEAEIDAAIERGEKDKKVLNQLLKDANGRVSEEYMDKLTKYINKQR